MMRLALLGLTLVCRPARGGLERRDQLKNIPTTLERQLKDLKLNMLWMYLKLMKEWKAERRKRRTQT